MATLAAPEVRKGLPIVAYLVFGVSALVILAVGGVLLVTLSIATRNTFELLEDKGRLLITGIARELQLFLEPAAGGGRGGCAPDRIRAARSSESGTAVPGARGRAGRQPARQRDGLLRSVRVAHGRPPGGQGADPGCRRLGPAARGTPGHRAGAGAAPACGLLGRPGLRQESGHHPGQPAADPADRRQGQGRAGLDRHHADAVRVHDQHRDRARAERLHPVRSRLRPGAQHARAQLPGAGAETTAAAGHRDRRSGPVRDLGPGLAGPPAAAARLSGHWNRVGDTRYLFLYQSLAPPLDPHWLVGSYFPVAAVDLQLERLLLALGLGLVGLVAAASRRSGWAAG